MKPHGKMNEIFLKKKYGQHFLRDQHVVDHMIDAVDIKGASIFEIGPGEGFLTRAVLKEPVARLWAFEIDDDWASYLKKHIADIRLTVFNENVLDSNLDCLEPHKPWTVLANLPYQITFPILHLFQQYRLLLKEGVIMVQEEVAQKIVKNRGRGYGYASLFFQHYFEWKLMDKIPPTAFYPPPKVHSRLLYFKPRTEMPFIQDEDDFWKFIKVCFKQPRRTLQNNLGQGHYNIDTLANDLLKKRAQELTIEQLLEMWAEIRK